jgi:hypothetical protein
VYVQVLTDWDDPAAMAREWLEMHSAETAVVELGQQLRADFWERYDEFCEDDLTAIFFRRGLRKVMWEQVGARLLERFTDAPSHRWEVDKEQQADEQGEGWKRGKAKDADDEEPQRA